MADTAANMGSRAPGFPVSIRESAVDNQVMLCVDLCLEVVARPPDSERIRGAAPNSATAASAPGAIQDACSRAGFLNSLE